MKPILIIVKTRHRPDKLTALIEMFYEKCEDKNNFDILCISDNDDIIGYQPVKDKYPEILWEHPEHDPGNWKNIIDIEHNYAKMNKWYFIWSIPDDLKGVSNKWDALIKAKIKTYNDDMFILYTLSSNWGRQEKFHESCYDPKFLDIDEKYRYDEASASFEATIVWNHCDLIPIYTSKWTQLMYTVFEEGDYTSQHDLISASLTQMISQRLNTKRCIRSDIEYDLIENQGITEIMEDTKGTIKYESFMYLASNDYKILEPQYNAIKNKIQNRKVLITGSNSGLGKHLMEKFRSEGYEVFEHNGKKHFDLTKIKDVKQLAIDAIESGVTTLINNAAIVCPNKTFNQYDETEILNMINVNLTAPILLCFYMREHLDNVININSMVGLEVKQPRTLYSATKWGLRGFSNSLQAEKGIPFILDVYPTNIKTTPDKENAMPVDVVVNHIYESFDKGTDNYLILDGRPKK